MTCRTFIRVCVAVLSDLSFWRVVGATYLEILNKPAEERDKVLGPPNVARNGLFQQIIGER